MKRFIVLSILVLCLGCISVLAQRGGNTRPPVRQDRPTAPDRANRPMDRANRPMDRPERRQRPSTTDSDRLGGQNTDSTRNPNAEGRRNQRPARIFRGLDLSEEQRQQIRRIQESARTGGTDRETVLAQIRGVLNAEQLEQFNRRLERERERNERRRQRRQNQQNQNTNTGTTPPNP